MSDDRGRGRCLHVLVGVFLSLSITGIILPSYGQEYRYDRLWPALQQPWYFNGPEGIAIEKSGGILVVDSMNARIQKYTSNGQLLTEWGTLGNGFGEFENPTGVAVDSQNNVYVTDTFNHRVQVFAPDGTFLFQFGEIGSGVGQFNGPEGIVIDREDQVFVVDSPNFRIVVFGQDGTFLYAWGTFGAGAGQFKRPSGIAISGDDTILVTDSAAHRVQQFTMEGVFLNQWGAFGEEAGQFSRPLGIVTDQENSVYVADSGNRRIQVFNLEGDFLEIYDTQDKFTSGITAPNQLALHPDGSLFATARVGSRVLKFSTQRKFLNEWSSKSALPGRFDIPWGIAVGAGGDVFATDSFNHRVQRFTSEGRFVLEWGEEGDTLGTFKVPYGIGADPEGNIYVTDLTRSIVQKFTASGEAILAWGSQGSGESEFKAPAGMDISDSGDVFIADAGNNRIQQFTGDGVFVRAFGTMGEGPGQLNNPFGVAVDTDGFVYVADTQNSRVQKFSPEGEFLLGWGSEGDEPGQFQGPSGLTIDADNRVYVADSNNHRIQVFSSGGELLSIFGRQGTNPGQFFRPETLALGGDGTAYVLDTFNSRIQRFVLFEPLRNKAIVVAGGDSEQSPEVLRAAEMCTNVAYRALLQQGYSKETIYFMRSKTDVDLDQNGLFDDVDATTTADNLQEAIVTWGRDASNLIVYLVGPGETEGFRIGKEEVVDGAMLDGWLDTLQQTMTGTVLTLYDASSAGSILPALARTGNQQRAAVASTATDAQAYFVEDGTVSFSNFFWVEAFNGGTLQDAAARASTNLASISKFEAPQVDGNGNGIPNEPGDASGLADLELLFESSSENRPPKLGVLNDPQIIAFDDPTVEFTLDGVFDDEGIVSLVRGVITPPGLGGAVGQEAVTELPTVDLFIGENNEFRGSSSLFTQPGTYTIDIYALDTNLNISDIQRTTVTKAEFSASIGGFVLDRDTRAPVINAEILVRQDTRDIGTVRPEDTGAYVVLNLESGTYAISASAPGYVTQTQTRSYDAGELAPLNFELTASQDGPLRINPASLDFGEVVVGESSELNLTLSNDGDSELTGTLRSQAPFEIASGSAYAMEPGTSHSVVIRFSPTEEKDYEVTMVAGEGDGLSVSLRGTGKSSGKGGLDCSPNSVGSSITGLGDMLALALSILFLSLTGRGSRLPALSTPNTRRCVRQEKKL